MNEKRVFSDKEVQERIKELNVVLIAADLSKNDEQIAKDLGRTDRTQIPVNLIYPADPKEPAILLEEIISPADALKALDLVAKK